jgi:heme/copper-type cytochrome/quinol oxidase subunit 3
VLFGLTFLGGQVYEFTEFYREGLSLRTSLFGSSFFVLTGLHGAHVTGGIVWLLTLFGLSTQGKLPTRDAEKVEIAGLYWHFVDIVWIVLFTVVYLMPQ